MSGIEATIIGARDREVRCALATLEWTPWTYNTSIETAVVHHRRPKRHPPGWARSAPLLGTYAWELLYHHRHWLQALGIYGVKRNGQWIYVQSIDTGYERRRDALTRLVVDAAAQAGRCADGSLPDRWSKRELAALARLAGRAGRWWPGDVTNVLYLFCDKAKRMTFRHPAWAEALASPVDDVPPGECARLAAELVTFARARWEVHVDEVPVDGGMLDDDPRRRWRGGQVRFPWSWGIDAPQTQALAESLVTTLASRRDPDTVPAKRMHWLLQTMEPWRGHVFDAQALRGVIDGDYGEAPDSHAFCVTEKPW